ncbi:MAG: MFS transporter [Bacteroidales bacterium]
MTQAIKKSLRESATVRWTVLGLVAFTMLTGYFFTDVLSPLKGALEAQHGWDGETYGFFTGAYAFFNVTFLMLIFGGVILDKMGIRFTSITSAIIMIVGASLNYYGLTDTFISGGPLFGFFDSFLTQYPVSVKCSFLGYAIFGMGVEMAGITVSKIIVKWFKGKELALAMGIEMAVARFGMLGALWFAVPISNLKEQADISLPVGFGVLLLVIGLMTFLIYYGMDKKIDKEDGVDSEEEEEEAFRFGDVLRLFTNRGFILIAILCVLFYSAVFPFIKFASDLMHHKYGMTVATAGFVAGLLPFGNMLLTPVFGTIYDRKGKGASIMILGSILLIIVHSIYAFAPNNEILAYIAIFILGVGFSLVPSAMWPSVPKIVDERYLGSAYAVIFFIQNLGLMAVPYLTGVVLKASNPGVAEQIQQGIDARYDYYYPSLIFVACGVLAFFFAVWLKAEDKKKGFGLELPNIKK